MSELEAGTRRRWLTPALAFTIVWLVVFLVLFSESRGWSPPARRFPWTVLSIAVVCTFTQIGIDLRRALSPNAADDEESYADIPVDRSVPTSVVVLRGATVLAWLLGVFLVIWLFNFSVALPLFVTSFVLYHERRAWKMAATLGIFVYLLIDQVFRNLLHTPWPNSVFLG